MLGLFRVREWRTANWSIEKAVFVDPIETIKTGLVQIDEPGCAGHGGKHFRAHGPDLVKLLFAYFQFAESFDQFFGAVPYNPIAVD